jgi:hypothetical protein
MEINHSLTARVGPSAKCGYTVPNVLASFLSTNIVLPLDGILTVLSVD